MKQVFFFVCASLFACVGVAQNGLGDEVDKLGKFLESIEERYVDSVETHAIVEAGIRGMLQELDPHSVYMDSETYTQSNESLKGRYNGIGVRYQMVDDTMTLLEILPGGAAYKAGLQTGDQVILVQNDTVAGVELSSSEITNLIKGSPEPLAVVQIRRESTILEPIEMEKSSVKVSSIPAYFMIDDQTGYIKHTRFSATSAGDFKEALDDLKKSKMKNLILDLRGNGGGYLNVAQKMTDEFLEDRKLIVYTEGVHQARKEIFATSGGRFTDGELYVLIDENSASASEILAGAIQDWDRGLIIGRRSFGKGLVQRTIEFKDGSAMRLTISRYYTPTGRSIQRPYDDQDLYRREVKSRMQTGELFEADSIKLNDELVYFTPGKRKVYGGGGIVPDVFVPEDTSHYNDQIQRILKSGLHYGFAFHVRNEQKESKTLFESVSQLKEQYIISDEVLGSFEVYASKHGVVFDEGLTVEAKEFLRHNLRASLARIEFGYDAYFVIDSETDSDVQKALTEIDLGTSKAIGLK